MCVQSMKMVMPKLPMLLLVPNLAHKVLTYELRWFNIFVLCSSLKECSHFQWLSILSMEQALHYTPLAFSLLMASQLENQILTANHLARIQWGGSLMLYPTVSKCPVRCDYLVPTMSHLVSKIIWCHAGVIFCYSCLPWRVLQQASPQWYLWWGTPQLWDHWLKGVRLFYSWCV